MFFESETQVWWNQILRLFAANPSKFSNSSLGCIVMQTFSMQNTFQSWCTLPDQQVFISCDTPRSHGSGRLAFLLVSSSVCEAVIVFPRGLEGGTQWHNDLEMLIEFIVSGAFKQREALLLSCTGQDCSQPLRITETWSTWFSKVQCHAVRDLMPVVDVTVEPVSRISQWSRISNGTTKCNYKYWCSETWRKLKTCELV